MTIKNITVFYFKKKKKNPILQVDSWHNEKKIGCENIS